MRASSRWRAKVSSPAVSAACTLPSAAVRARDGGGHRLREPGRELVDEGQEERFLVREVVVDGALGRAGGPHDVVDQSPVIPFLGEDLERRLQNLVARRRLRHLAHPGPTPEEVAC